MTRQLQNFDFFSFFLPRRPLFKEFAICEEGDKDAAPFHHGGGRADRFQAGGVRPPDHASASVCG